MSTPPRNREILISGASVAGPVLAYWLARHGFRPTVVELAPSPRKTGGHAVDLFGPAVEVVDRMGLLDAVTRHGTDNRRMELSYGDGTRSVGLDVDRLAAFTSDRHVEIMRDDLTQLLVDAADVEYRFADSVAAVEPTDAAVAVTFASGERREFDLLVGADGLHSNVRRLTFGPESRYTRFIGAYLAVYSLPSFGLDHGVVYTYTAPGRVVAFYRVRGTDEMRAVFVFRADGELHHHHRDTRRQRELVRERFSDLAWHVPRLLSELDDAQPFYFDSITQVHMDSWSRGRVTLVGDAAYSPGPAVGGGTSLAMLGAYELAGSLSAAGGDFRDGFARYEQAIAPQVRNARAYGRAAVARLAPGSPARVWASVQAARLVDVTPLPVLRRLSRRRPSSGPILDRPLPVHGTLTRSTPPGPARTRT